MLTKLNGGLRIGPCGTPLPKVLDALDASNRTRFFKFENDIGLYETGKLGPHNSVDPHVEVTLFEKSSEKRCANIHCETPAH